MTRQELTDSMQATFDNCLAILKKKNADYASEEDAFKNFRMAELVGINYLHAIILRIADKVARITNCLDKEVAVSDETVADTIDDAINYLGILKAGLLERNKQNKEKP